MAALVYCVVCLLPAVRGYQGVVPSCEIENVEHAFSKKEKGGPIVFDIYIYI